MKPDIEDAITYTLLATLFVAVIMLQGCSTLSFIAATVEESSRYCQIISETIEAYQQCMDRETRFISTGNSR